MISDRDFSSCGNAECENPKNGSLKESDYTKKHIRKDGKRSYRMECKVCYNKIMKEVTARKHQIFVFADMTDNDMMQCPLDVRKAQEFCLGRLC